MTRVGECDENAFEQIGVPVELVGEYLRDQGPDVPDRVLFGRPWFMPFVVGVVRVDETEPASVGLLGAGHNAGGERSELRSDLVWECDPHLGDVDLEQFLERGWDVDGDASEFAVFVHGSQSVPPSALDHAIAAVDVEALLAVPFPGAGRGGVGVGGRKLHLADPSDICPGVSTFPEWWVSNGRLVDVRPPGSKGALPCPRTSGEPSNYPIRPIPPVRACRRIGVGAALVPTVALDHGRFLTLPPKGEATIISASTGRITRLPIPTGTVRQAELDGSNLLILRRESPRIFVLDVRDASTGALRQTWPLSGMPVNARSVHLEDAHSGIVVYRIGTAIHVLRVTDGKSHTIVIPANQGPVHARLEDPGLIYSFTLPGRPPRGRIEFVPLAHLVSQLR